MPQAGRRRVGALIGMALVSASLGVVAPITTGVLAPSGAAELPCPGGSAPADRFTDDDGSVHEDAIACTTWWELTRGVSDTAYSPGRGVTRGQAATLLARLLVRTGASLPASPPDGFPDDTGGVHSYATNRLAALDVVDGRADGRYAPNAELSRGAMASLLVATYRERTGIDPPRGGDHFTDDDGTVHEPAIDQAAELGLTLGSEPGRFDPWAPVSRGQAASLLARTLAALDELGLAGPTPLQLRAATALEPVDSCEPLLGMIKQRALESVGPFGLGSYGLPLGTDDRGGPAPPTGGDDEGSDGGGGAPQPGTPSSGTNNQETGVDEADIVKVAGTLVVAVNGGVLRVVDAAAGTPVLLGTLPLGEGGDHRLLLDGDRLLVVTTSWEGVGFPGVPEPAADEPIPTWQPLTVLRLVDLSDPSAPAVTEAVSVDGWVLGARLVGGVARIVVRTDPAIALVGPASGSSDDLAAAAARNRAIIESSTLADWSPQLRAGADGSGAPQPLLGCGDVSTPPEFAGLGFSSVLTIDLDGPLGEPDAVGVLAGSDLIYASPTTLYLTSTRWDTWQPALEAADPSRTDLHAFDISDPAGATFLGSGRVVGHLLNQFSLSEHEGVLRVASTTDPLWWDTTSPPGENRVTTLRLSGGSLEQVGLVTGLGVDERIFGVRFLGDLGYVVTFRLVDPLHVLDLSDPANPVVTGELEMQGYSAYLHPIGDGRLLGVGADADADGMRTGLQLSVFDVSDPTAPQRLSSVSLPGAWSDVEYDHLAFLWWPPVGRAVVPVIQYEIDGPTGEIGSEFVGAIGFAVDAAGGISEVGRATHVDDVPSPSELWTGIRRSLVVDGTLLTLSDLGIEAADLEDLTEQAWLPFAP